MSSEIRDLSNLIINRHWAVPPVLYVNCNICIAMRPMVSYDYHGEIGESLLVLIDMLDSDII